MTTNLDRAADVLAPYRIGDSHRDMAQALAAAGLIAPDPIPPTITDVPEWETPSNTNRAVSIEDGTLRVWGDLRGLSPAEASDLAACLLSAADYAEEHTNDQ